MTGRLVQAMGKGALAGLAALVVQGCAGMHGTVVSGDGFAPTGGGDSAPVQGAADYRMQHLSVAVTGGGEEDSAVVAGHVADRVSGALAERQFTMDATYPDILVNLDAAVDLFDQSGNYYVYDGRLDARVMRTVDHKIMGRKMMTARGPRTLDKAPALRALADVLAEQAIAWVGATCTPAVAGLSAVDITVRKAWYNFSHDASAYAEKFVRISSELEGVVSSRVVEQDYARKQVVFRMVYQDDAFPEGVLNRLALIPELNIKPRS